MIAVVEFIADLNQGYAEAFLCRGEDDTGTWSSLGRSGRESITANGCAAGSAGTWDCPPAVRPGLRAPAPSAYSGNWPNWRPWPRCRVSPHALWAATPPPPRPAFRYSTPPTFPLAHRPRRRVLLFDWWILNFDRTEDNPNLLWDASAGALHVIDHNLAFDDDPTELFWTHHIFPPRPRRPIGPGPARDQRAEMEDILSRLPLIWSELPELWTEASERPRRASPRRCAAVRARIWARHERVGDVTTPSSASSRTGKPGSS